MSNSVVVSQSITYKPQQVFQPKYQLSQLTPQTGSTTITLTPSGRPETIFEIPSRVINLSKSILTFDVTPASEGTKARYMYADNIPFISSISLYTRNGVFLCDITSVEKYSNTIFRRHNRPEDVLTWDEPLAGTGLGDSSGFYEGLIIKSLLNNATTATIEFKDKNDDVRPITIATEVLKAVGAPDGATSFSNVSVTATTNGVKRPNKDPPRTLTEPAYYIQSASKPALTGPFVRVRLPLRLLSDTIISLDKDQYYGEPVFMRIIWNESKKIVWTATNLNDPDSGKTTSTADLVLSNLYLFACFEQNQVIIDDMLMKYRDGTSTYLCPYIITHKQQLSVGDVTLSVRYSTAQGQKIRRIYVVPYDTNEDVNTCNDHNNKAGAIITSYHTMLNNVRTSQINYNCTTGQDYTAYRHLIRGSCIHTQDEYYYNWCHEENFLVDLPVGTNRDLMDDGLTILNGEVKYDFLCSLTAVKNFYVFSVLQRMISISPNGIVFI